MIRDQFILGIDDELIGVLFAGMGGMCHAIERALGRHVDFACNHNVYALACHRLNHPQTKHYPCDVFELDPARAVWIEGAPRVIWDIGMRMFAPRELARGMGFWDSFVIDRGMFELPDGSREERPLTRTQSIELIGNAVSPYPAEALVLANAPELSRYDAGEREEGVA
jgi:site-specific DNA-cytosine methylase